MKILFAVVILAISISSCKTNSNDVDYFNKNKETTIKLIIKNVNSPKGYMLYYFNSLPISQTRRNLLIESDTIFNVTLPLNHPIYVTFFDSNSRITFFSIPDDTLQIIINYEQKNPLSEIVEFKGKTGDISSYLTRDRNFWVKGPEKNQSVIEYNNKIDAFFDKEYKILDSLFIKANLPKWFVDIEKERIACQRQNYKLMQFNQRYWMHNQIIPEKNEKSTKNIKLPEINNYWLIEYFELLSQFREEKYDTLLMPQHVTDEIFYEYTQNNINSVKDKVSEEALSYFVSSKLSIIIQNNISLEMYSSAFKNKSEYIEDIINKNRYLITDSSIYSFLISIKEETFKNYRNHIALNIGDPAPDFILLDIKNKNTRLSEFKGKVVLLNFWGTYCKPCIESIPEKNKLYKEFSDEDFVLLNICLNSDYDGWKQIINKNNFKGRHFICRGNWQEILATNYNISNIPRYVLIDKYGNIAKTDIRDSLEIIIHETLALND